MKKYLFLGTLGHIAALPATGRRLGPTGTYDLQTLRNNRRDRLSTLPLDEINRVVQTELAAHNRRANEMIAAYAMHVDTRDGVDATGQTLTGEMFEVDEYGRAPTQISGRPSETYFPLRRYQFAAGYTADFFRKKTPADLVAVLENAQAAHRRELVRQIQHRLFSPFNYEFEDFLTDGKVFSVKAFYNGDGVVPPAGVNLQEMKADHNHYMAFSSLTEENLRQVINNTREHSDSGQVEVHISAVDEGTVRAFAGFAPATDIQVTVNGGGSVTANRPLDTRNTGNRFIGRFDGVDVHVKPWIYDHYACAVDMGSPALGIRHPDDREDEGLRMIGQIVTFPLQSDYWGAEFGIGVRRRGGATMAQFGAAGGQYTDPTGRIW
ncbi:hypothetical protein ACFP81_10640 [Deinococcus lacus]|uniref:Major capsid protein n=1 Tax=Deinococcus lacus TaxID=392561 RepID=A0ABW1YFS1_9DEIO